ncbi:hypothetical protein [Pleionea sp. CnH1-48]|uniref:hypothetical protein n=1 Tax=Pleionea sp. CnH1-48 TaxID=2954494 RepID=UPI002097D8F8|nr:hypothetical protein [Pleionea sp. CnH1-48]MCO7225911.1 hypothetical protein [Pleionea sp. CnH1-48]
MATLNLHRMTHLDHRQLTVEEIRVGLFAYFPSGVGGILKARCVALDDQKAVFESIHPDWPLTWEVVFNQPDFTNDEFAQLSEAMKIANGRGLFTNEQNLILHRASQHGYIHRRSVSQVCWSEKGWSAIQKLN